MHSYTVNGRVRIDFAKTSKHIFSQGSIFKKIPKKMFFESFNLTKKILKTRFLKLEINVFIVLVLGWEGHVPPTKH